MSGIRLSKKHGVNPTIKVCFFCGEDTNEIAFLGKLPNDEEAPKRTILDYCPCDKCKEKMDEGVTLIEVDYSSPCKYPSISKDSDGHEVFPTGRWCVITKEGAEKIFGEHADQKKICVDTELFGTFVPDSEAK